MTVGAGSSVDSTSGLIVRSCFYFGGCRGDAADFTAPWIYLSVPLLLLVSLRLTPLDPGRCLQDVDTAQTNVFLQG